MTIQSLIAHGREIAKKATKRPWFYGAWGGQCHIDHQHGRGCVYDKYKSEGTNICSEEGFTVCTTTTEYVELKKSEGEFITTACNQYDTLLSALEAAVGALEDAQESLQLIDVHKEDFTDDYPKNVMPLAFDGEKAAREALSKINSLCKEMGE